MHDHTTMTGFTLIELVITMTLAAILSVVVAVFIARPITAYVNVTRRAELMDAAHSALRRIARDIQAAVPNSVRVKVDPNNSQRVAIEILNIVEGMRYRATPPGPFLDFTQPVTTFNVIGQFQYALSNLTCAAHSCRVVVYSTGENNGGSIPSDNPTAGANVYSTVAAPSCSSGSSCVPPPGSVVITPVGTTVTLSNTTNPITGSPEGQITLSPGVLFALASARQRLDIVDTPTTYLCDSSSNTITRYWGYTINAVQPTNATLAPLNTAQNALLAQDVTACNFIYTPGTSERNGIVTLSLTFSKSNSQGGDTITLMRQVSVDNTP
jgi:MSHA biogenesis protein MshO